MDRFATTIRSGNIIQPMSKESIDKVRATEEAMRKLPQIEITTTHVFHAGVYSRTVVIPKNATIIGTLIKRSTNLSLAGHATVFVGDDQAIEYKGYAIIQAHAGRKQIFIAHEDTYLTMFFATTARTIEEAEKEFTDEAEILMSRRPGSVNQLIITGE